MTTDETTRQETKRHVMTLLVASHRALNNALDDLGFEEKYSSDAGEGHPLAGHLRDLLHAGDLRAGVSPLAPIGPCRLDHLLIVQSAQERWLDSEHPRDLAKRVQSRVFVVERQRHRRVGPQAFAGTRDSAPAPMAVCRDSALMGTRRGLAFSATGIRSVKTPSV